MEAIEIKLRETADRWIDHLNAYELELDNSANSSIGYNVCYFQSSGGTAVKLMVYEGVLAYPANDPNDISTAGKNPITEFNGSGYILLVVPINTMSRVLFVPLNGSVVRRIDFNGTTSQSRSFLTNYKSIPEGSGMLTLNTNTKPSYNYELTVSEWINDDVVVNFYNMSSKVIISGNFNNGHKSIVESLSSQTGVFYFQITMSNMTLDIVNVPSIVPFLRLEEPLNGAMNTLTCSSSNVPFLQTVRAYKVLVMISVLMDTASIDNLLIACSNSASTGFTSDRIELKGTRSSASDAAISTLIGNGVTVVITP